MNEDAITINAVATVGPLGKLCYYLVENEGCTIEVTSTDPLAKELQADNPKLRFLIDPVLLPVKIAIKSKR